VPAKGQKLSAETRLKISLGNKGKSRKGHPFSKEVAIRFGIERKGSGNPMFGKHHSEETGKKMSASHIGMKCPWITEMLLGKPNVNLGRKRTEEQKKKLRGRIPWNKGKPNPLFCGKNNPKWKDGISLDKKRYMKICRDKRRAKKKGNGGDYRPADWEVLKKRYGNTCPICLKSEPEIQLTPDHIVPISLGGSNFIENIQPLCMKCNLKKHQKVFKINSGGQFEIVFSVPPKEIFDGRKFCLK